jgi:hypothetical protein
VSTHFLDVDSGGNDLDVVERELRALSDDLAIEADEGAAVIVETVAVASLLVGVEVDTTGLDGEGSEMDDGNRRARRTQLTLRVASLMSSMRVESLRSSW